MEQVTVAVLGPLEVRVAGRPVCLAPMEQALLVALLARANQVVTSERLIGELWPDPASMPSRNALHALVRRLRRAVGVEICHTRGSGYLLTVQPDQLDRHRFETLTAEAGQAAAAGDLAGAAERLQAALALWRGPALAGVPATPVTTAEAARLEDLRLAALEQRIEAELRLGRHTELAGELTRLVAEHPVREPLYNQLMLALYRSGRRSEALEVYRTLRRRLVEELGLEPSKASRDLERAMLTADPALQPPEQSPVPAPAPPAPAAQVPYQLPASSPTFTGRRRELEFLRRLFTEGASAETMVVAAIYGTAGIGKSALALTAGHQLREAFGDGQLYVDLRGGTPGLAALDPGEVLGRLLRGLGVEGGRIPSDPEERSALYRSLTAGRRTLVLIDNAADPAQVRPLLPGAPGGVLVTSRQLLPGLEGATHLHLGVLSPEEAVELLGRLLGAQRVQAEPAAAAELARLCGYLPLALRIAGARLAGRPRWPLGVLIERLTEEARRLDELVAGDLAVRSSFEVSYRGLSATPAGGVDQARVFRLLSLLDGPDVGVPAAAALLDEPPAAVEAALERLVDAHLLETPAPGRYGFHDLLRLFARERAADEEPERERTAALVRVLRWYLAGAERANRLLCPGLPGPDDGDTRSPSGLEAFADRDTALAWLERERANLLAAAEQLARAPGDRAGQPWRLAEALFCFLDVRGYWPELERVCRLALTAARRRGDRCGEAHAHRGLAALAWRRYRLGEALGHLRRSLALFREVGDVHGRARSLNSLGLIRCEQQRYDDAVACYRRALALFGQVGDRRGEGQAHNNLGEVYRRLGRRLQALDHLGKDLAICRELGDRRGEAITCCNLGEVQRDLGRRREAVDWYRRSLAICQQLEDHRGQGINLSGLGDVCLQAGQYQEAAGYLRHSVDLLERVGDRHREADALWRLGLSLDALGDREQARACWRRAHATFQEIDAPEAVTVGALVEQAAVPG